MDHQPSTFRMGVCLRSKTLVRSTKIGPANNAFPLFDSGPASTYHPGRSICLLVLPKRSDRHFLWAKPQ